MKLTLELYAWVRKCLASPSSFHEHMANGICRQVTPLLRFGPFGRLRRKDSFIGKEGVC